MTTSQLPPTQAAVVIVVPFVDIDRVTRFAVREHVYWLSDMATVRDEIVSAHDTLAEAEAAKAALSDPDPSTLAGALHYTGQDLR